MKQGTMLLTLVLAAALPAAQAQTGKWPDKSVRVVVPFAAGGSTDILTRLNQATGRIINEPDMQQRLRTEGREPAHSSPEEFQRIIARDIAKYTKVVKVGNIKVH